MSTRTAAEALQHHIRTMGEPLGRIFHALFQEVSWLYSSWNEYLVLFGNKESRVDLLNQAAPHFFGTVQNTLYDCTLLHIARLTDSSSSAGKPNLTIRRLPSLMNDPAATARVQDLVTQALQACEFCRDLRNRRLAHHDLDWAMGSSAKPLPNASRLQVKAALEALTKVLSAVGEHYEDSSYFFDIGGALGGAERLLPVLRDGLHAQEERLRRIERGEFSAADLAHDEI